MVTRWSVTAPLSQTEIALTRTLLVFAALSCAALVGSAAPAAAEPLRSGLVYLDVNGSGVRDPGEPGVARVLVRAGSASVRTDSDGTFSIIAPVNTLLWARTPDSAQTQPTWAYVDEEPIELRLLPATTAATLEFVVASDLHANSAAHDAWSGGDVRAALGDALANAPAARFVAVLGDISQSAYPVEFNTVQRALGDTPMVPVPGNHDWYDGGTEYHGQFGPDQYSLEAPGVHLLVWNGNLTNAEIIAFVESDLATRDPKRTVIGFAHQSPDDDLASKLDELGVSTIFTGHWHATRHRQRGGISEWGVQPLTMGGIDQSPSGYRVIHVNGQAVEVSAHMTPIARSLAITTPLTGSCVDSDVMVSVLPANANTRVTLAVDCGEAMTMTRASEFVWQAELAALSPGPHRLDVRSSDLNGIQTISSEVTACSAPIALVTNGSWLQAAGGATHVGASGGTLTPPLALAWQVSLGGTPWHAAPLVDGELVIATTVDPTAGANGTVTALDRATGNVRWRRHLDATARHTPAVSSELVVVVREDGVVEALERASGVTRWTYQLTRGLPTNQTSAWAPPTVVDDSVFVAVQGRVAALALATGVPRFVLEPELWVPWLGTQAAISVAHNTAVFVLNRSEGLWAIDATTGALRWKDKTADSIAINAAPLIVDGPDGVPLVVTVNAAGVLSILELASGTPRFRVPLVENGFDWGYVAAATPASAGGLVLVPTVWGELIAVRIADGTVAYRVRGGVAPINVAHYRPATSGFPSSPVIVGDSVITVDGAGELAVHGLADGVLRYGVSLGIPSLAAPTPMENGLLLAGLDGQLRALVSVPANNPRAATSADEVRSCAVLARERQRLASAPRRWLWPLVLGCLVLAGFAGVGLVVVRRRKRPRIGSLQ